MSDIHMEKIAALNGTVAELRRELDVAREQAADARQKAEDWEERLESADEDAKFWKRAFFEIAVNGRLE